MAQHPIDWFRLPSPDANQLGHSILAQGVMITTATCQASHGIRYLSNTDASTMILDQKTKRLDRRFLSQLLRFLISCTHATCPISRL